MDYFMVVNSVIAIIAAVCGAKFVKYIKIKISIVNKKQTIVEFNLIDTIAAGAVLVCEAYAKQIKGNKLKLAAHEADVVKNRAVEITKKEIGKIPKIKDILKISGIEKTIGNRIEVTLNNIKNKGKND